MEKLTWKNIHEHGIELWEAKKNEFIKAVTKDSDFSWILDGDKKLLYEKVKEKASINYGIPTQITGNPQIARCFLCLFNPSVSEKNSKPNNQDNLKDYFKYVEDVVKGPNKMSTLKSMPIIVNINENILNLASGEYYYNHYFKGINNSKDIKGESLVKKPFDTETLAKAPICNLELVPYRSRSTKGLKNVNFLKKSSTIQLTVEVIVRRILDYWEGKTKKPYFFMRAVKKYEIAINSFLSKQKIVLYNVSISSFQDLIDNKVGCGDGSCLFYELPQSGSIVNAGLRPLLKTEEINQQNQEYGEMIEALLEE